MPPRGRPFPKGVSGNPAGGPRGPRSVHSSKALFANDRTVTHDTLVGLLSATDERVRLAAAIVVLERLYGKPRNEAPVPDDPTGPRDVDKMSDDELEARMLNGSGGAA